MQHQGTISQLDGDVMKSGFYMTTVMSVVGPRRCPKALSKANFAPKKGHGHCLVVCCLSDPPSLSESQWNHYIWEVCSANQWEALEAAAPAAWIGQQNGPSSSPQRRPATCCTTSASKAEWIGNENKSFPLPPHSPDLSQTDDHFCKHLNEVLQGKCFHTSGMQKMHSQSLSNPKARIFTVQE